MAAKAIERSLSTARISMPDLLGSPRTTEGGAYAVHLNNASRWGLQALRSFLLAPWGRSLIGLGHFYECSAGSIASKGRFQT